MYILIYFMYTPTFLKKEASLTFSLFLSLDGRHFFGLSLVPHASVSGENKNTFNIKQHSI